MHPQKKAGAGAKDSFRSMASMASRSTATGDASASRPRSAGTAITSATLSVASPPRTPGGKWGNHLLVVAPDEDETQVEGEHLASAVAAEDTPSKADSFDLCTVAAPAAGQGKYVVCVCVFCKKNSKDGSVRIAFVRVTQLFFAIAC